MESSIISNSQVSAAQLEEEIKHGQNILRSLYQQLDLKRIQEKAVANFTNATSQPESTLPPSQQGRKQFSLVSSEIKQLVVQHVLFDQIMSWEQAQVA